MDRIGQATAVLVSIKVVDNTRTGKSAQAEFEGSEADVVAKKFELIALGASDVQVFDVGNGYWRCIGSFGGGFDGSVTDFPEAPSIHELKVNTLQTSIWRSKIVLKYLTVRELGIIQRVIKDYQAGLYPLAGSEDTAEVSAEDDLQDKIFNAGGFATGRDGTKAKHDALNVFKLVAYQGQEDFIEYTNVYQRTLNAATPAQAEAKYEGVGKIWTTKEVADFEQVDPTGFFKLDADAQWLKSRVDVTATYGQRIHLTYSYTECQIASGMTYEKYKDAVLLYPPAT